MSASDHSILFPFETDTALWAAKLAPILHGGDTILLSGEIGAGKSAFARALIRARLGRMEDIPSPTFTIVQTYQADGVEIWHCDLYRLTHPDEAFELGLDDAFATAICLIEWPDRLGAAAPHDALHLAFVATPSGHQMRVIAPNVWTDRLADIL